MKKASILLSAITCIGVLFISCNNIATIKDSHKNAESVSITRANDSEVLKHELEAAFSKMFKHTTFTNAADYFMTDVADEYIMIGADGILETKKELLEDTERLKMLEKLTFNFYDQKIRIYNQVGILNGRSQAYMDSTYVAEFLYTAIFVKENEKWMYTSWQGTLSKDSPQLRGPKLENENSTLN